MDKYAPLTAKERAGGGNPPRLPENDGWELIAPVPGNAPAPPEKHPTYGKPKPHFRWQYRDPSGAPLFWVWRFDLPDKKKQFPSLTLWHSPSNATRWLWKTLPEPRPLYSLDKLAACPDARVLVCEGEKSADAAARLFPDFVTTTSPGGGKAAAKADWTPLAGRAVTIWPDADEPGSKYAAKVASMLQGLGCQVSVIDAMALAAVAPDGGTREVEQGWDAANAEPEWEPAALRKAVLELTKPFDPLPKSAAAELSDPDFDQEITRLAGLTLRKYERERTDAAKKLGLLVSRLDKLVAAERPSETPSGQGQPLELSSPEPWPTAVNGTTLVAELTAAIRKYVVLAENAALAAALWILHTYCFDLFPCTPRLAITAPEKQCGKNTLLEVIELLVPHALPTANISVAATFRTIETVRPTLLIDEADTFLGDNEELRGILNSGHRKGGHVVRTVGDDFEPRIFSTHCPVAIAQIGKLPDTLADRSIQISMKRRAPGEAVSRFRGGRTPELAEAARKAARWVADNSEAIRECEPIIPDAIYNRAADNWEPLLTIGEVAGSEVAARGRQAALAACGVEEELSQGAALLADIRGVFEDKDTKCMTSADLVAALVAMADRPWGECNRGKPLTQNGLARKLKDFKIRPEMIGPKERRVSGYTLKTFEDSFARYIPAFQAHTLTPHNKINSLGKNQTSHRKNGCEVESSSNALNLNELCGCEVSKPESGIRAQNGDNVTGEDMEIEL